MKNVFRWSPVTPLNNATYVVVLAILLPLVELRGPMALHWATQHFSDAVFFIGGGFLLYLAVFWGCGLFYILLDRYQRPAFLFRYRIQIPPPGAADRSTSPRLPEAVRRVLFNQFFGTLPVLILAFFVLHWMGVRVDNPVPGPGVILLKLTGMVLIEEVLFFSAHYALHSRRLFRTIHHIHHRFRQPIGISTHYVHFAEHLIGNLVPIFSAIILVRADVTTAFLWVTIAVMNAIHSHSDYAFPWMADAVNHDFHHYLARGNYGVLGLLDWVFGTDKEYREMERRAKSARTEASRTPVLDR